MSVTEKTYLTERHCFYTVSWVTGMTLGL